MDQITLIYQLIKLNLINKASKFNSVNKYQIVIDNVIPITIKH